MVRDTRSTVLPPFTTKMGDDEPGPSAAGAVGSVAPETSTSTINDPLYGAPAPPTTPAEAAPPPARPPPLQIQLPPSSRSPTTPTVAHFLRRLSYILSIVIGTGAVLGLVWGKIVLPMLHATFSARRALTEVQVKRWERLLLLLKSISSTPIYGLSTPLNDSTEETKLAELEETDELETTSTAETDTTTPPTSRPTTLLPLEPTAQLTTALRALGLALQATQTTRTSLLSTLESYTSTLHRSVFLRSNPSLGSNFAFGPTGREREKMEGEARGEEWDAVRKEVRAIKGLLLGRRSFASPSTATVAA